MAYKMVQDWYIAYHNHYAAWHDTLWARSVKNGSFAHILKKRLNFVSKLSIFNQSWMIFYLDYNLKGLIKWLVNSLW